jgi:signal transduction histidine kinase/CheY-like chemotaxis protein
MLMSAEQTGAVSPKRKLVVSDVFEAIDQGVAVFDEDDRLIVANGAYKKFFDGVADLIEPGVPFESLIRLAARRGQNVDAVADPEAWVQARLAKHRAASGVYEHKFSDGRWIQVQERKTALGQTIGTYTDVTPLVQRSEELAKARDRLDAMSRRMKGMIEASSDWIWSSGPDGQVSCEPQSTRADDGFDPALHIGAALRLLLGSEGPNSGEPAGRTLRMIHPVKLPGGRTLFLKISGKPIHDSDGVLQGHVGTASDETEKIGVQRDAAQRTAVLESVLDSILSAVIVFGADRQVLMSNRQTQAMLGLPVQAGDPLQQLRACLGDALLDAVVRWSAAGRRAPLKEAEVVTGAGRTIVVRGNFLSTGGFVLTFADVTEQRTAQAMNHQSQKLVALGQLSGGVAHEFNNLLTSISGFAHMARQYSGKADLVADCLNEVIGAAERAAELTRQMLTFSRKDRFEEKTIVATEIVNSLAKMMQPLLPETVALSLEVDDKSSCIKVDVAQMSQALMNLVINARDSMPNGGSVVLRVAQGAGPRGVEPGRWLTYSVTDEGTGIDAATLPRIFDPFFTTKEQGKGTGLGLSVVHSIVQRSGGHVTVDSIVGRGTTFSIHLPLAEGQADQPPPASAPAPGGCGQMVWVVEDEPGVRRLAVETLQAQGYRVCAAADNAGLTQLLQARPQDSPTPHLLLTDVVLPGKSGPEIAVDLRQRFPGLPVLFMSGYVAPGIESLGLIDAEATVLSKPFAPETLCRAVSQALGVGPPQTGMRAIA